MIASNVLQRRSQLVRLLASKIDKGSREMYDWQMKDHTKLGRGPGSVMSLSAAKRLSFVY
jgi:hypothetical protein